MLFPTGLLTLSVFSTLATLSSAAECYGVQSGNNCLNPETAGDMTDAYCYGENWNLGNFATFQYKGSNGWTGWLRRMGNFDSQQNCTFIMGDIVGQCLGYWNGGYWDYDGLRIDMNFCYQSPIWKCIIYAEDTASLVEITTRFVALKTNFPLIVSRWRTERQQKRPQILFGEGEEMKEKRSIYYVASYFQIGLFKRIKCKFIRQYWPQGFNTWFLVPVTLKRPMKTG
jgi:hypothetical protein